MTLDRMDWHYGGDYPEDLPQENSATHIGMFLAWAFNNGLVGELHLEDSEDELEQLKKREITGSEFIIQMCDEKLWDEDFNEVGAEFAIDYYNESEFPANYLDDYSALFDDESLLTLYHLPNTWENFDRLKPILDQRFEEWKVWKNYK